MNVFDLSAKVSLDTSAFEKGLGLIEGGLKGLTASIGAGAAAVGKMVSDSVSAYGSYEQLVGGVQTLFGDSAQKVLENSEQAFRTAGMSMNEYMETSIQSAAALINSLEGDQAQAAELMDMSITDMSDNVNKMGTTMEAVQNAYRGFSRQNFTMLDNLALGFAGTKEGMQELLDKAEQISGIHYDISSYSDIVKAIHVVQQEMGITGTTAAEAADTIQGSVGSMKAAWENLKVELVKEDGDIGKSIDILINSSLTMFDNIEPKIERALGGVSEFVGKAAPLVAEKLPPIIEKIVPPLLSASSTLVYSVGKGIAQALPSLLGSVGNLATGAYSKFAQTDLGAFDWIREDIVHVVSSVKGIIGSLDFTGVFEKVREYGDSLGGVWEKVGTGFTWLVDNVFGPLAEWGVNDALPKVFDILASSVDIFKESLEFLETPAKAVWQEFLQPLGSMTFDAVSVGLETVAGWLSAIADTFSDVDWEGYWLDFDNFGENWQTGWDDILGNIEDVGDAVDEFFDTNEVAKSWNKFWQGVGGAVYDFQTGVFDPFCEDVKLGWDVIGEHFDNFKTNLQLGYDVISDILQWITDKFNAVKDAASQVKDVISEGIGKAEALANVGSTIGGGFLSRFLGGERHALGGIIINKPMYDARGDLWGEAGREAVLPLDNNTGWMDKLADRVNSRSNGGQGGVVVQNLYLTVEGGRIADDYDTERFIEKVAQRLGALNVKQERTVGGIGWT